MRKYLSNKKRVTMIRQPAFIKGLAVLVFLCLVIRLAVALGADSAAESFMLSLAQDPGAVSRILDFEIGGSAENVPRELTSPLGAQSGASVADAGTHDGNTGDGGFTPPPYYKGGQGGLFYGDASLTAIPDDVFIPPPPAHVLPGESTSAPPSKVSDIHIVNSTDYEIDIPALYSQPLKIKLDHDKPAVLIIHTHSSEAYTQTEDSRYEESDEYRTQDKNRSIIHVGDELTKAFEARGISVIHDRGTYDYPSYTGSYNRSGVVVADYIRKYPSIQLVIDLHRDAIAAEDGSQYKTLAQVDGDTCSQVMFYVGTDAAGLTHPNWRENMKLALHLQYEMDTRYPSLTRPIRVSRYRYNQDATPGSLILEVGTAGNTLEESVKAVKYFADVASDVILSFY